MATSIGKLSKSFFLKLLVGIIILPFVFWGMGDVFRGGNQNVVATVDSNKISTQEFINYINLMETIILIILAIVVGFVLFRPISKKELERYNDKDNWSNMGF